MPVINFTPTFMATGLVCPPDKDKIEYGVAGEPGLFVECRASKKAKPTWYLRLKNTVGTNTYRRLGTVEELPLMKAKIEAQKAKTQHIQQASERLIKAAAPKSEMTLQVFMDEHYMPFAEAHKRTAAKDAGLFRNHIGPRFGHLSLDKVPRHDVQIFHHDLLKSGCSPATADHNIKLMRRMLNLALEWQFLEKNQLSGIKLFNIDNQVDNHLDDASIQRLLVVLHEHPSRVIAFLLMFLLSCGARKASAMNAKWEEIDLTNRVWRIPATNSKSKRVATVPLNDSAMWVLGQLKTRGVSPYLFINAYTDKPYVAIEKTWYDIREKAGLRDNVRIHDLRHTFASLLVRNGVALYDVQKILDHSDPKITMRYAHLSSERLQQSANSFSLLMPAQQQIALSA